MTKKEFNLLRTKGNYGTLGANFFRLFVTTEEGKLRDKYSSWWLSLTKEERLMCEGVYK
jgi:hypothetical protein